MRSVHKPILFEISWEAANKGKSSIVQIISRGKVVGGIYTVLKTKVPVTVHEYTQKRYFLIGPWNQNKAQLEVEQMEQVPEHTPQMMQLKRSIQAMRDRGVHVVFGKWLIESSPYVILMDLNSVRHKLAEWRGDLFAKSGIPCPEHDGEMDDAVLFGYLVSWFLGEYSYRNQKNAVIAHFHEWQSSVGLVLARIRKLDVATIFTTHATLLGRYLCAGEVDFYNNLHRFDVDYEAGRRGIYHRYCVERGAASSADVFTTVSHITAYEAENLLKRKPDGITPNGLNLGNKSSAMHEFQNLHALHKDKIHEFVRGHFYGHMDFDLDNTLYFFTAGRYEYRNKGADMFLEALAQVNGRLKHINSPITVVAFIIMPAPTHSYSVDALKGQAVMKQLRETVNEVQQNIGRRIFEAAASGRLPNTAELLTEEEKVLLKRRIVTVNQKHALPPIVTHNVVNDDKDPILNHIRRLNLINLREDRVKVVFHPEFLNSNNQILGIDYEDFVRGCHLGVFPSYYEPYGYTPAECTVYGVPSVSTNLSGFGCFMEETIEDPSNYGIYIVDRRLVSAQESVDQLADVMLNFCQKSRRQRINLRNRTERLSDILDWKSMGLEYVKARRLSLRRQYPSSFKAGDADDEEVEWHDLHEDGEEEQMPNNHQLTLEAFTPSTNKPVVSFEAPRDGSVTPIEAEDANVISPLKEGRKIRKPFSAPSSPKLQAILHDNEEIASRLLTGLPESADSPSMLASSANMNDSVIEEETENEEKDAAFQLQDLTKALEEKLLQVDASRDTAEQLEQEQP